MSADEYAAMSRDPTFRPGSALQQILVRGRRDKVVETDETFAFSLSKATGGVTRRRVEDCDAFYERRRGIHLSRERRRHAGNSGTINAAFGVTSPAAKYSQTVTVSYARRERIRDSASCRGLTDSQERQAHVLPRLRTSSKILVRIVGDTAIGTRGLLPQSRIRHISRTRQTPRRDLTCAGTSTTTRRCRSPSGTPPSPMGTRARSTPCSPRCVGGQRGSTVDHGLPRPPTVPRPPPADYLARGGTVTFAAGESPKQIIVSIVGDTAAETD